MKRSSTIAVDGDALALQIVGQQVSLLHILNRSPRRQIDCLAHGGVRVPLPGGLHADVPLGTNVSGRAEDSLELIGQPSNALNRSVCGRVRDNLSDCVFVAHLLAERCLEDRIDFDELLAVENLPGEGQREHGLDAGRA